MSLRTGRFSSLKIFGGNGGNSDKKKPPPPPPKDPNYLANLRGTTYVDPSVQFGGDPYANTGRSPYYANSTYQSQSQASFSDTAGPSSYRGGGNYEASVRSVSRTRGNYNPTTTSGGGYENSLASQSAVSLSQQSMTGGSQEGGGSMKKKKGGRWGSLGRNRSKKSLKGAGIDSSSSPSPLDFSDSGHGDSGFVTVDTPEDASISMPWNFQHHVHVDEGYTGLPPSWTARLTAAGFTEEEILSIQARRKSPGPTVPLPHGSRSGSPAPSLPQMPPSLPPSRPSTSPTSVSSPILVNPRTNSPILANPNPRASSLPRKFSDASLRSNPYSVNDVPPVPRIPAGQHSANSSVSSLSSFGAQSNVPSPLGLSRTISPSPGSVLGQSITGGQNRVPRKLVVANEPIPRASTSSSSSASSSESSPPAPPPRPPRLSILEGAKGETAEDWSQSLLSSTLSFDAATGKPLSFNGYSSSATNTDDEGDGEDEDRAGWRDTIVQGKRNTVVPDKRETLKPAPRHAPPKPLTLDVREDEYEEEEDEGEDDEDKRGTIIMDRAPPMSAVTPPGPMQALASVLMNRANGRASPASSPELSPPPQFPTSNGSSPPVVSSPAPPAAYLSESFSNHKPNASVSSLGSVVSPSNSQHSANSASSSNGPLTHRSNGSNSGLANLASRKSASAGAPPQRPPPNLPPPPRPSPPALSSSGSTEIGPPPIAKLPSPPPVPAASSPRPPKRVPPALPLSSPPMFKIQATSIGEEGPVVEREKGTKPQTKRDTLPPPNTAATTGTGNLTPLWKELAGMVRPVDDAEQEDGEYYHGESVAPLKTSSSGGSKQERGRSRSPPAASSSSNSKPNHSPALVEVYSPTLPLSPGGLERHDMMIGGGGMQPFALGVDSPGPLKREEQVEEKSAFDRLWDGDESPSSLLRPVPTLPAARDSTSYLSLSGASQDRDSILGSYYGGEEGRTSTEFPTTPNEFGERLSTEFAEPSTIVSRPSVDSTRSPTRHEFLRPSIAPSPPRAPAPPTSSSSAPPPSTFSRYQRPGVSLGLSGPRDSTATDSSFRSSTTSMSEYDGMDIGMMEEEAVVVSVAQRMNVGLAATIRPSPSPSPKPQERRSLTSPIPSPRSPTFSKSPSSPAFSRSPTSPEFGKSPSTGEYLDTPGSAADAQRESHLLYYLDGVDSPLSPPRDPYSGVMEVEQEDQDNGERGDASSPSLPLKKASSKPQIRITTPALPNTPPPTVPHIPIPPLSHEPSPLGVAPIYAPSPLSSPGTPHSFGTTSSALPTPIAPLGGTPFLGRLLSPLEEWIERDVDAKEYYTEVTEIAEGESGFVCSAVLNPELAASLPLDDDFPTGERTVGHMGKVGLLTKLSVMNKAVDVDYLVRGQQRVLAIKAVTLPPPSSQQASGGMLAIETPTDRKLKALSHELTLLRDLSHANILLIDSLYLVPPTGLASQLWIRMELMDRSLADVIGLIPFGLMVLERMIARLAGDLMSGLEYLHGRGVVHRDVRSDNCLLDHDGVLKLTDFSNAISVEPAKLILLPMAGVLFYQAPEVRILPQAYDPFKLDVYSAGATVWEMANGDGNPPWFDESGDTSLAQNAQGYPPIREERRSFWTKPMWDFLNLCEKRADERPSIEELVKMSGPFLGNASGRPVIVQLLAQATNIETRLNEAEAGDGMERDDAE